jgi:hypothetical protein
MNYKKVLAIVFIGLLFISCNKDQKHAVDFYYWKTQHGFSTIEKKYFHELNATKLYIRVFDVDDEGKGALPKAKITVFDSKQLATEYIPVVFITARTFEKKDEKELLQLSRNVNRLIDEICMTNGINNYHEIQIDCDWTAGIRNNYFLFLKTLKSISGKKLSVTIRLHQVKYKKNTGVPPVDAGVVMCYATADPRQGKTSNSILNIDILKDYLQDINDYPLPVDMALPLYSWAVVTNHLGKIRLINAVSKAEADSTLEFEKVQPTSYRVKSDMFFHGMLLNKDFTLRIEEITPDLLMKTKAYLKDHVQRNYSILYYHLDDTFLRRYKIADLQ